MNYNSSPAITNVTLSCNSAWYGGGIFNRNSSNPTLTNIILWGNSASVGQSIYNEGSTPSISYSNIQGCGGSGGGWQSACGVDGGHNIDQDPLFVDPSGGNLRLQAGSPAIDKGNNSAVPSGVTTDLDGNPRFVDGNGDGTATVDMGAFEYQSVYYTLQVTISGTGSGTVSATGCTLNWTGNTGTCTASHGTSITLSATPSSGSTFAGWSNGTGSASGCSGTGTCSFTITQNSSITATFNQSQGAVAVPTMTEWGMIMFMIIAGLGSVYYLRRRDI
ncbi:MAG: choice-of-anchor Q domain-containing protein [Thermodesulforhabdaceae bacterium]